MVAQHDLDPLFRGRGKSFFDKISHFDILAREFKMAGSSPGFEGRMFEAIAQDTDRAGTDEALEEAIRVALAEI